MKRALSLYLPMWSIDRARRKQRGAHKKNGQSPRTPVRGSVRGSRCAPLLLITTTGDRQLIAQCCEQARAAGVRPGMTLAHARALLPMKGQGPRARGQWRSDGQPDPQSAIHDPQSLPFTPYADAIALRRLARWCTRFCPTVALDPELDDLVDASNFDLLASHFPLHTGLLMDITGCDRLYRGEHNLVRAVADAMHRFGLGCRIAIGPTFGAAWALARFGDAREHHPFGMVLPEASLRDALRDLPVRALRIGPEVEAALAEVAIDRVGHLYDLPRSQLPSRFGDSLLLRLDQALGQAIETIDPVRFDPPPEVAIHFNGPTTQFEAIELASRQLVERLIVELQSREAGVRELVLALTRAELDPAIVRVTFTHPTRDVKHLWSLLRPQLEKAHLGHGVDRLSLTARRWGRLRHEQRVMKKQETGVGSQESDNAAAPPKPTHSCGWVPGAPGAPGAPLRLTSDEASIPPATQDFTSDHTAAQLAAHRGQLLDVLLNRLGPPRVLAMAPVATHMPSKAFRFQPAGEATDDDADGCHRQLAASAKGKRLDRMRRKSGSPSHWQTSCQWHPSHHKLQLHESLLFPLADRPSLLFDRPEPARVMAITPDGPPVQLHWRGCDLRIVWSAGPLRLGGEWWRAEVAVGRSSRQEANPTADDRRSAIDSPASCFLPPAASLDFFRLACDDGQWLWVSRSWSMQTWHVWGMWV